MPREEAPTRILQALSTGELGGTELMVLRLLRHLDPTRFVCDVSVLDGRGPVADSLEALDILVHDLSGKGGPLVAVWRFRRLLVEGNYDLVHCYGFRMGLIGRVASRLSRSRPTVVQGIRGLHVTESEEPSTWKTRLTLFIEWLSSGLVDHYLANSRGAVEFLSSRGLPAHKFTVVPNGMEITETENAARSGNGPPRIVCVANFRPRKRHVDLIEALALLRDRSVEFHCVLVGDGVTRGDVEALARRRGLDEPVAFTGLCSNEDVRAFLSSADIFVLPSLWEGAPVSVLEAMAARLPVVATDVPGTREVVVDGVTGLLVAEKDACGLADALERLIDDPGLRSDLGAAGRDRIERELSVQGMTERLEAAYENMAQRDAATGDGRDRPAELTTKTPAG